MTVKELIDILKQYDENKIVEFVITREGEILLDSYTQGDGFVRLIFGREIGYSGPRFGVF